MNPKVSVAILTHGSSGHLKRALESIYAQTYKKIEVIVVYDGPADDAAIQKILQPYEGRLKYYSKEDDGVAAALNFAIQKSTGQYFSWLSHDDVYSPEKIELEVALMDGGDTVVVVSDWDLVNRNDRKVRSFAVDRVIERHPACYLAFAADTQLNTCAMLFPLAALQGDGRFDATFPSSHDFKMLNCLIMAGAEFRITKKSLVSISSHSEERYSSDPRINTDHDFTRSNLIATLPYEAILAYFGSRENALGCYGEMLESSRPRSAAFLMERIISGSLSMNDRKAAEEVLLSNLSGLPADKMAADADSLLSKILQPSNRKKILFCSAHWLTGGMERVMSVLFRELMNDYEIFLITPYDDRESHIDIPDHVTSVKISEEHFQKYFDTMILTYSLLLDIDVAVGFINLFDKQLNLYKLCAGTKIKTIASNHEYYFYPYKSPVHYHVVEKRLSAYAACDAVIWPNGFNAALCGMYTDDNYVIGNPNNFEVASKINTSKENVIICVGRFNDYVKRIDRILECFSLVLENVPDAKLVIVGKYDKDAPIKPGGKATVNSILDDLAIPADRLDFVGEVNNVQDYYAKAKVLMLTSNSEGFGMVLNEAACFGVPSVCNYIPGVEDIISDGENGYITAQGDLRSMASRVGDILSDGELHKELSENAKKKATAYDSKHVGDKWRYLIASLLDSGSKEELRQKLNAKLGYGVQDQRLFSDVLSKEINEIFYISVQEQGQHRINNSALLLMYKAVGLPKRLKANIEYEGLAKTVTKILTRSLRIARNRLKI